jgi:hypothetical protein
MAQKRHISEAAVIVSNETWNGPRSESGDFLYYGVPPGTNITVTSGLSQGTAVTTCANNGICTGVPFNVVSDWISVFVERNPGIDIRNLTHSDYDRIFHASLVLYAQVSGEDTNLMSFSKGGGKILGYHGMVSYTDVSHSSLESQG